VSDVLLWLGVGVVGGGGALARFLLDGAISTRSRRSFPVGTFAVNLTGSALLGFLAGIALTGDALLIAGTGVLGSYTTFSTWMFETHRLSEDGELRAATLNVLLSLAAGLGAVALGRLIGGAL
jgi:fluoride exporter